MPQRSNDFQRLIYWIEKQLAGEARVVESLLLPDRDGTPREIDITIESAAGVHPVRIAIECRDHARPADVTWIEQLYGKYRDLPVSQVVAVSKAGFTRAARAKAAAYNIRALTLNKASHADWARSVRVVASVEVAVARYPVAGDCVLTLRNGTTPPSLEQPLDDGLPVLTWPGVPRATLQQLVNSAVSADRTNIERLEASFAEFAKSDADVVQLTFHLAPLGVCFVEANGTEWPVDEISVPVRRERESMYINLTHADYGGAAVAYGDIERGGNRYRVVTAAHERSQGEAPIVVTIDPPPPWLLNSERGPQRAP